jgi:multidrug efflux pump subunit AcrA (membrane-fusion protein)
LSHCVVSLIEHVQLPAQLAGVLVKLDVKEGDIVRQDQELGRVDDTETKVRLKAVQAKLAVAREKAEDDSELKSAKKVAQLYQAEYEESDAINRRSPGAVAETQLRRQRVQWEKGVLDAAVAEMSFAVGKLEQKVAEVEVEAGAPELKRRIIIAPFDGVIVNLLRQQSEWVQPGDPILKVYGMKRLRVEGFVSSENYSPEQVLGATATVSVKLPGAAPRTLKPSKVGVSPVVEASGDYRIWAEIDNPEGGAVDGANRYPWLLRPGSEVEMTITLRRAAATPSR